MGDNGGKHAAFPIFVPVSLVANVVGKNPYTSRQDAISELVSKNARTLSWRSETDEGWVPDKLESALNNSSDDAIDQIVELSGIEREIALTHGLVEHISNMQNSSCTIESSAVGAAGSSTNLSDTQAVVTARRLGIDTAPAARDGTGIAGVKSLIDDHVCITTCLAVKVRRRFGTWTNDASLGEKVRIEIASSKEPTFDGAVSKLAEEFGTTLGQVLRMGSRGRLRHVVRAKPQVARSLPKTVPVTVREAAVSEANRTLGADSETTDVDAVQTRTERSVTSRNSDMKYGRVYVTSNVAVDIGGRVDGISGDECGQYLVESKRRLSRFLGIPDYERIQMELYMRLFGMDRCLHVETFGDDHRDRWVLPDDALLSSITAALKSAVREEILPRTIPAIGSRTVADPFKRYHTVHVKNPTFSTSEPSRELAGMWVENGCVPIDG